MVAFNHDDSRILKLVWTITGGVGVPVLLALARRNTRAVTLDRRMVRNNVIAVVGLLVGSGLLSAGIFHRAWESVVPWPAAGPALPAVVGVEPGIDYNGTGMFAALTPNGRLWLGVLGSGDQEKPGLVAIQMGEGKTWTQAALGATRLYGLDSTGSLYEWDLRAGQGPGQAAELGSVPMRRVGAEGEWKAVSARATHAVGLKKDGTLWGWGRSHEGQLAAFSDEDREEPAQMSPHTDWTLVHTGWSRTRAANSNNEVWRWGTSRRHANLTKTEIGSVAPYPIAEGKDWVRLSGPWFGGMAETADGNAWIFEMKVTSDGVLEYESPVQLRYPLRGISHTGLGYVALTESGELMFLVPKGDFRNGLAHWLNGLDPVPLGNRTDWVGLTPYPLAFTADGVVWSWQEDREASWLRPSRRPYPLITLGD